MSDHADTLRRALCGGTTLDEAHTALEALVAENQRLRDALEVITTLPSSAYSIVEAPNIARAALDGTP